MVAKDRIRTIDLRGEFILQEERLNQLGIYQKFCPLAYAIYWLSEQQMLQLQGVGRKLLIT